jgi:hypothetical protein
MEESKRRREEKSGGKRSVAGRERDIKKRTSLSSSNGSSVLPIICLFIVKFIQLLNYGKGKRK